MNWIQFPQLPELNSFKMTATVVLARDWFLQMLHIPSCSRYWWVEFCKHSVKGSEKQVFLDSLDTPKLVKFFTFIRIISYPSLLSLCDLAAGILTLLLDDPIMRSPENPWGYEQFCLMCSSNRQQVRHGATQWTASRKPKHKNHWKVPSTLYKWGAENS